jgi:hypothetical protein
VEAEIDQVDAADGPHGVGKARCDAGLTGDVEFDADGAVPAVFLGDDGEAIG